jgi:3'-5' exoribonuclease
MFDELEAIVRDRIERSDLKTLVQNILNEYRKELLVFPAARHNHHAFAGGLLEHTLSVAKTALFLADKYADYYPDMQPPLDKSMVIAGAILHDIGKLREYETRPEGAFFSAEGAMIGHMLLGRDIVREAAAKLKTPLDAETLLRLEHAVIAHQRLPEWGSPKPPMTPEAMLIHYADDIDAKFHIIMSVLRDDTNPGPVTSKKNLMMQHVYRGMAEPRKS